MTAPRLHAPVAESPRSGDRSGSSHQHRQSQGFSVAATGPSVGGVGRPLAERVHASAANQIAKLTLRQRQILDLVVAGQPSKNIAADLWISQRTVENHRASIMRRTGAKSIAALARLAQMAAD